MVINEARALHAVHRLVHQGRQLAGEGMSSQELFIFFDELDGLIGYIIAHAGDKSEMFEKELERVCIKFGAVHISDGFKRK
ncbi:hypothetical protein [Hymenobacter psoromatis]|uniref:hypothetical protein n=1 Tax=Hymenobacter psoromatis TaxID=1484116 RepID=UPI001CBF78D7|nr:hypothetical protein [Hymenobacter psoromatis]